MRGGDVIHLFQGRRRVLFFPRAWANSVARWILSLTSETGTVRVTNTPAPDGGRAPSIDVDVAEVVRRAEGELAERFVSRRGASGVDGVSVQMHNGELRVNEEWLDNFVRARIAENAQAYA